MRSFLQAHFLISCFVVGCWSCSPREDLTENKPYPFKRFNNIQDTIPQPSDNRATIEGVALGKMLFFDPILSKNGNISCATCHQPEKWFSDGFAQSTAGTSHQKLPRNSPSLINTAFWGSWFWDGGAKNLESQVFGPLTSAHEMAADIKEVIKRLNTHPIYPKKFKQAFGIDTIHEAFMAKALAQFERTLISFNSPYDKFYRREKGFRKMNNQELAGFQLFNQHCQTCHKGELFTDNKFYNVGLDIPKFDTTGLGVFMGRKRITFNNDDLGKYRTPSLRNVAVTSPYMHDGRFKTLKEVMDFYRKDIKPSPNLAVEMFGDDGKIGMDFSEEDSRLMIQFLNFITDSTVIKNPHFLQDKKVL